jgi:hypothetical protein
VGLYGKFIGKLAGIKDGEGTLLDHSALLLGSGLGDGNAHNHQPLAALLAGHAGGHIKGGQHLKFPDTSKYSNLLATMLLHSGVRDARIGDSDGYISL